VIRTSEEQDAVLKAMEPYIGWNYGPVFDFFNAFAWIGGEILAGGRSVFVNVG